MIFILYFFFTLSFFLVLSYGTLIGWSVFGLRKAIVQNQETIANPPAIDVIIAFRNEQENLPQLLKAIENQQHQNFKIILVNDHSTDNSVEIIRSFDQKSEFIILQNAGHGKKAAIRTGISASSAPLLVFTDADCMVPENWLATYSQLFSKYKSGLFFGWVYNKYCGILQKAFSLEFLSLTGVGMGMAKAGLPIYMNGANYAVTRDILNQIPEFDGKTHASGDDVFLLHAVKKHIGAKSIYPCTNKQLDVQTRAPKNLQSFIQQRIRWGSKTSEYSDKMSLGLAIVVFMLSLMQIGAFVFINHWPIILLLWFCKAIIDFTALVIFQRFSPHEKLTRVFPLLVIFYPFYIVYTSIAGLFISKSYWLK